MHLSVIRLVFLTADAALGQPDDHARHMPSLLSCPSLMLPVATLLATLAADPFPLSPPAGTVALTTGDPASSADALRQLLTDGCLLTPGATGGHYGSVHAPCLEAAQLLAAQFAATSLGHGVFGAAVALQLQQGGVAAAATWRKLAEAHALAVLPPVGAVFGGKGPYLREVAGIVAESVATGVPEGAQLPLLQEAVAEVFGERWAWQEGGGGEGMARVLLQGALLAHVCHACALIVAPLATMAASEEGVEGKTDSGVTAKGASGGADVMEARGRWRLRQCLQAAARGGADVVEALTAAARAVEAADGPQTTAVVGLLRHSAVVLHDRDGRESELLEACAARMEVG
jgi:hypothetical protein